MKIKCTCGHLIIDQTDYLKHKGYLISDTQWFDFWDAIDNAIENPKRSEKARESVAMNLRNQQNLFTPLWECTNCGKLYINGEGRELIAYSPNSKGYNQVLDKKE